jgi:uncharacterized RDD family membrane protein YckC
MEKAKISKRIAAYFLDILFIYLLIGLISSIKVINPYYEKYNNAYEEYSISVKQYMEKEIDIDEFNKVTKESNYYLNRYGITNNIVSVVVLIGYFVFFQKYNNGQTLGKKIMKIKVVTKDNKIPSIKNFLLRLLLLYYAYVGNLIVIIIVSILSYTVNITYFANITTVVTYVILTVNIISLVYMISKEKKDGIHEIISNTIVINEK